MGLNVRVEGIDRVISHFDLIKANVAASVQSAVDDGAKQMRDRAKAAAPIRGTADERKFDAKLRKRFGANKGFFRGKPPGTLRRKIVIRKGKHGIVDMVQAKAPHAPLQEYGTRRGVKAKHFMERTKEELLPGIQRGIIAAAIKEVK